MSTLPQLANDCDEAAASLAATAYSVRCIELPHQAFGVDGPGRLADLGMALHDLWLTAVDARAAEASTMAGHLADTGAALRAAASGYTEVDDDARRRFTGES